MTATFAFIDALIDTEQVLTTAADTCPECDWILFGGLWGGAWCVNESCAAHHVDILAEGVSSSPSPASEGAAGNDESESDE